MITVIFKDDGKFIKTLNVLSTHIFDPDSITRLQLTNICNIGHIPKVIGQCVGLGYNIELIEYKPHDKNIVLRITTEEINLDDYPIKYDMFFDTETNILMVDKPNNMCNQIFNNFVDRKIIGIEKISNTEYKIKTILRT